jgi:hypothetical protein
MATKNKPLLPLTLEEMVAAFLRANPPKSKRQSPKRMAKVAAPPKPAPPASRKALSKSHGPKRTPGTRKKS